jgi:hypothetical protein
MNSKKVVCLLSAFILNASTLLYPSMLQRTAASRGGSWFTNVASQAASRSLAGSSQLPFGQRLEQSMRGISDTSTRGLQVPEVSESKALSPSPAQLGQIRMPESLDLSKAPDALVPMTDPDFAQAALLAQGADVPTAVKRRTFLELNQTTNDIETLDVRNREWLPEQLRKLNALYDQSIDDSVNYESFKNESFWSHVQDNQKIEKLMDMLTDEIVSKHGLFKTLRKKLEEKSLKNRYINLRDIDPYIETTASTLKSFKKIKDLLAYSEDFREPEFGKDMLSALQESSSLDEFMKKSETLLNTKYKKFEKLFSARSDLKNEAVKNYLTKTGKSGISDFDIANKRISERADKIGSSLHPEDFKQAAEELANEDNRQQQQDEQQRTDYRANIKAKLTAGAVVGSGAEALRRSLAQEKDQEQEARAEEKSQERAGVKYNNEVW